MTSGSHKFIETPAHRLRIFGVVLSLALVGAALGGIFSFVGSTEGLGPSGFAAAGAVLAIAGFALGSVAMPLAHWLLGDLARHRLIAAASPLHPLLKRLMTEAPGTYVHSVAVANLSEAAATAIGADGLLARVAAYYHDVGKLARPCYFFENAEDGFNPHDETHPATSVEIITSHVQDGLALAEQYRLPQSVTRIIEEHHGTSLVRYFYHKASAADAAIYESDFRYRGNHPGSKESAIVMLADASEASVRAMLDPDTQRVTASVRSVFDERRADGQLEDSGLRDEEYEIIMESFVRNLVSFRHVRCQYPYEESMGCEVCR